MGIFTITIGYLYVVVLSLFMNNAWISNDKFYLLTCLMRRMGLLWSILMFGYWLKLLGDSWKHFIFSTMLMMMKSLIFHWLEGCSCCFYDVGIKYSCYRFPYGIWWLLMSIMILQPRFWGPGFGYICHVCSFM